MHPRTPARLAPLAETFRQVGAICWAATHLEYQLEVAIAELTQAEDLDATQGWRWGSLVDHIKKLLKEGVVTDPIAESGLRDLLSRITIALNDRDEVAHTTWLRTREVIDKPGYIVGQRYRTRGRDERLWHTDELENVREGLEALTDELSSAAYNAVRQPSEWI